VYSLPDEIAAVDIPQTENNLYHRMQTIDPLTMSDCFGIDLFQSALNLVQDL